MKTKNLIILAAVVIVVLAYILLIERHRPTTEEASKEAEKVLHDFDRDDVEGFVITSGARRVRLEKTADKWRLREPLDYPADSSLVNSTLGSLANLTADRRLAATDVELSDYGFDSPTAEVALRMMDGAERTVTIGDELPLGSKRALRVDGGGDVVIASGWFVSDLQRDVNDWRSHEVFDALEDQVASIDVESGADSIRAVRLEDRWQLLRPLQDMADDDHLASVISDLRSMRIKEFLDDDIDASELGLEVPEYEITVVRADGGEPLRLDLGVTREGDAGTEVACRRGDGEYFWASEKIRDRLSKAPVLWRSKKVMPFETWDVLEILISTPEGSTRLVHKDNVWRFDDDTEAKVTTVQERLRELADLEATDYDLMAPMTQKMGSFEVVLEAEKAEEEAPVVTFDFYAPLEDGGRAMVEVTGRSTVMGVAVRDVEAIVGTLEDLRPELSPEASDEAETE